MARYVLVILLSVSPALASAAEPKKPVWREDLTDVSIPSVPAQGMVHGVAFKVEKARLIEEMVLELRQGKEFHADRAIRIVLDRSNLAPAEIVDGKKFESTSSRDQPGGFVRQAPTIYLVYKAEGEGRAHPQLPTVPQSPQREAMLREQDKVVRELVKGLPASQQEAVLRQHANFRRHAMDFKRPRIQAEALYRCTMKLHFSKRTGNKIKGKIYLCLPDGAKSFVAGVFEAEIRMRLP